MNYNQWIESLQIFAKYAKNGLNSHAMLYARYDAIYAPVSIETVTKDSEDGDRLLELGWIIDSDSWMVYV